MKKRYRIKWLQWEWCKPKWQRNVKYSVNRPDDGHIWEPANPKYWKEKSRFKQGM